MIKIAQADVSCNSKVLFMKEKDFEIRECEKVVESFTAESAAEGLSKFNKHLLFERLKREEKEGEIFYVKSEKAPLAFSF